MKAEKALKVRAPLEAFSPGDFVRACWPHDCDYIDTYIVVGCSDPCEPLCLVSTRDWMAKVVINDTARPVRFDSVDVDVYERDKRLNAPR